jgi:hypothetical protein
MRFESWRGTINGSAGHRISFLLICNSDDHLCTANVKHGIAPSPGCLGDILLIDMFMSAQVQHVHCTNTCQFRDIQRNAVTTIDRVAGHSITHPHGFSIA